MDSEKRKWFYLVVLSLVWGSSYILIKKALIGLDPVQLGVLRILFSAIFLFLIGFGTLRKISSKEWPWVALSAVCGTLLPVFLFAFAQTEIASSVTSILNSLVPLFTIILGYFLFQAKFSGAQVLGVLIGLAGAGLLIFQGAQVNPDQNYWYALLIVIASLCYSANANIVKSKLQGLSSMAITVGNFAVMLPVVLVMLPFTGVSKTETVTNPAFKQGLIYVGILSLVGTSLAKILFNRLIQISTPVFSTSVTYLIPLVGIFWGVIDGETFTWMQVLAALIILGGVYLVNSNKKS
ncbi:MAG: EamA family transporter [Leeuwenhoekiella sp.]